ncbi:DUF406 family protein [Ferrimonas lipolytica]|uniref:DUF406 family protein n=1 Tax=Ferrimonas lipolytica TaxID=2724191 RepID=A0A6H1UCL9_9GAMM|nr:DUF406 family protein [Ferrimonas lipolytica]QIZ76330.1 DUF406 family protein [Ferrimonas lipolytica]
MSLKLEQTSADCCGAYADIGSVISAEDNVLDIHFNAEDEATGMVQFAELLVKAQARFADVTGEANWENDKQAVVGHVVFSCAAERLIFEMGA